MRTLTIGSSVRFGTQNCTAQLPSGYSCLRGFSEGSVVRLVLLRKWDEVRKKFLYDPQLQLLTILILEQVSSTGFQIDQDQVVCNDPKLEIPKLCVCVPSFRRFNASKNLVIH